MNSLIWNAERYHDPTAGAALQKIERDRMMEIKAGDVIKVNKTADRFYVVIGVTGAVYTCVLLWEAPNDHCVPVVCRGEMYANPEKIEWVNSYRQDVEFVRTLSETERAELRKAVNDVVGEFLERDDSAEEINRDALDLADEQAQELIRANARADIYKELYESLLRNYINPCMASA